MNIPLGYEVGTGRAVSVPLGHLVVTGQSQESGKTTTLEALITRSGLRAVAFVTKRGEKSFRLMTPIRPYFRERADWQFVQALFEAALHQKQDYKQAWIMRACEGAKTLADVQANCQRALRGDKKQKIKPARGLNADMYYVLDNYFDQILPEVERLGGSPDLKLARGINVMDLAPYSFSMQALVIRSVLEHVYLQETGVVTIIPEAWEFVPRGRRSPVKLAAEEYHRKAAANRNFLWLDSQDLAGIDRNVLRSAKVWIFGVQRDQHEIKRTLESIPDLPRPNPREIATLGKGQFVVAFGTSTRRVYVQPAGMEDAQAQAIARGDEPAESWGRIVRALDRAEAAEIVEPGKDVDITSFSGPKKVGGEYAVKQESGRDDETGTGADVGRDHGNRAAAGQNDGGTDRRESGKGANFWESLRDCAGDIRSGEIIGEDAGEQPDDELGVSAEGAAAEHPDPADADRGDERSASEGEHAENWPEWPDPKREGAELVWQDKYEALERSYQSLANSHDAVVSRCEQLELILRQRGISFVGNEDWPTAAKVLPSPTAISRSEADNPAEGSRKALSADPQFRPGVPGPQPPQSIEWDAFYRYTRDRLVADAPSILQLVQVKPELRITVQRQTLDVDGNTLRGRLALLIAKGFFDEPKNGSQAHKELARVGGRYAKPSVYDELERISEFGFLTREKTGYHAVSDMKKSIVTDERSKKSAVAS